MSRRRIILLGTVAAAFVAVAIAVPLAVVDGGDDAATTTTTARPAQATLPPLLKADGYFTGRSLRIGTVRADNQTTVERGEVENIHDVLSAQYQLRAFPRKEISAARTQQARASFAQLPFTLPAAASATGTAQKPFSTWKQLGTSRWNALPNGFTVKQPRGNAISGRIMALAIARRCTTAKCRVWVGTAGGGVWRTDNALAGRPRWKSTSHGITSAAIGSLTLDPTDSSGRTIYAGTGELGSGGDSEAGTGVFRSTNGGDTWEVLRGSPAVARDRAVTGVAVDPTDADVIYLSTARSVHGSASVFGGEAEPPGSPPTGVYKSVDGGDTFTKALVLSTTLSGGGVATREVTQIQLDPNDPKTVYAAVTGSGLWRLSARADGDDQFHQVFSAANSFPESSARIQFAIGDLGAKTRLYLGDSDPSAEFGESSGVASLFRSDDALRPAQQLLGANKSNGGWTALSSPVATSAGYDSFRYCQEQCWYDNVVASPPGKPDVVWLGGMFNYGEAGLGGSNGRAVVRSNDAGEHFTDMSSEAKTPSLILHPDVHALIFSPTNPEIAFVGSDGGLYRTSGRYVNQAQTCAVRGLDAAGVRRCQRWLAKVPARIYSINDGLPTVQLQSISVSPDGTTVLAGSQDNGTWEYTPKKGWRQTAGGDGGQSGIALNNPSIRFHTYYTASPEVNYRGFDPAGWAWIGAPLAQSRENTSWYMPFIVDPKVPGSIFAGLEHVWRSKANGGNRQLLESLCTGGRGTAECGDWKALGAPLTGFQFGEDRAGYFVAAVERAPSDAKTLWAATLAGRVFVTRNANAPAKQVKFRRVDLRGAAGTKATPGRFVSGITIDPKNPNHAWISYSGYNAHTPADLAGHVFEVTYNASLGRGFWKNLSLNLGDEPITDIARDAKSGDLYAATDFGVVRLPKGARSWTEAAPGLPLVAVYGLTLSRDGRTLYAATHGRGAWHLKLR